MFGYITYGPANEIIFIKTIMQPNFFLSVFHCIIHTGQPKPVLQELDHEMTYGRVLCVLCVAGAGVVF